MPQKHNSRARRGKVDLQMRMVTSTRTFEGPVVQVSLTTRRGGECAWRTLHRAPCAFGKPFDDQTWVATRSVIFERFRVSWLAVTNGAGCTYWR